MAGIIGKNILALSALAVALPGNLIVVAGALLYRSIRNLAGSATARTASADPKTVLISGGKMTKALQLARSFHAAGHRVVLVESHKYWLIGHRFSRAVDRFHTLPPPDAPDYASALLRIVEREKVDLYVPVCSPLASFYDSQSMPLLTPHCDVMHVDPTRILQLDDKFRFAQAAQALDLAVPKSFLITDPAEVEQFDFAPERRPYILKSIAYDSVRRLDLTQLTAANRAATLPFIRSLPISPSNPWILQEFISGREYCTHGTFRNGELRVHCCCLSSAFQVNYANVDKPVIEAWVERFSRHLGLTGQASFDFIEADDDGRLYAIECNPRTHSAITMFYNHPGLADAYLGRAPLAARVRPLPTSRPTYWLYHELWRLIAEPATAIGRLRTLWRGKDAVFDWRDPVPFLMLHHWQIPLLLLRDLRERRGWVRIDFNIGKLVQAGGD